MQRFSEFVGVNRDEKGRVRIAVPRLDNSELDEQPEEGNRTKRPKTAPTNQSGNDGLFAVLPEPKGPSKRNESRNTEMDNLFAKKKMVEGSNSQSQTIKMPTASAIRYEAELKKAAVISKFLKKPKAPIEEQQSYGIIQGQGRGTQGEAGMSGEVDYLGLTSRYVNSESCVQLFSPKRRITNYRKYIPCLS